MPCDENPETSGAKAEDETNQFSLGAFKAYVSCLVGQEAISRQ